VHTFSFRWCTPQMTGSLGKRKRCLPKKSGVLVVEVDDDMVEAKRINHVEVPVYSCRAAASTDPSKKAAPPAARQRKFPCPCRDVRECRRADVDRLPGGRGLMHRTEEVKCCLAAPTPTTVGEYLVHIGVISYRTVVHRALVNLGQSESYLHVHCK
jgi:hypothetical protein